MEFTTTPEAKMPEHKISRFVVVEGALIRRTATMRGTWAHEARCSCGWETRTGGAVKSYVDQMVKEHKWDVANGFWQAM